MQDKIINICSDVILFNFILRSTFILVCGGTFTESKGIIESPFYPNPYPNRRECIYIIAQPVGKAIRLSFLDLEIGGLSYYPKCRYDSLEVK